MKDFSWKKFLDGEADIPWKEIADSARSSAKRVAAREFAWKEVNVAVKVPVPGRVKVRVRVRQSQAYKLAAAIIVGALAAIVIMLAGLANKLPLPIIFDRALIGFGLAAVLIYALEFLLDRVGIPQIVKRNEDMRTVWTSSAYDDEYLFAKYLNGETKAAAPPADEAEDAEYDEEDYGEEEISEEEIIEEEPKADAAENQDNGAAEAAEDEAEIELPPPVKAEEKSETDSEIEELLAQVAAEREAEAAMEQAAQTAPNPEELKRIAAQAAEDAAADAIAAAMGLPPEDGEASADDAPPTFHALNPDELRQVVPES